jgi:hypothetical protein
MIWSCNHRSKREQVNNNHISNDISKRDATTMVGSQERWAIALLDLALVQKIAQAQLATYRCWGICQRGDNRWL